MGGVEGGGWSVKLHSIKWEEPVCLIGAMFSACSSGQDVSVRFSGGSDPSVDVLCDDCYFYLSSHKGGGPFSGSSEGKIMLPSGYFFPLDEGEKVFIDVFSKKKNHGGHAVLYYVLKSEWDV